MKPGEDPTSRLTDRTRSLTASLGVVWRDLLGMFSDRVALLSLELHRAGLALTQVLFWTLAALILALTGWLALCGTIAVLMVDQGMRWVQVLPILMVVNFVVAMLALSRAKALAPQLALPVTTRHLRMKDDGTGADDADLVSH